MQPQRGMPFRPPIGSRMPIGIPSRIPSRTPSRSLLSPKGASGSLFARPGVPSRISSLGAKSAFGAVRRSAPAPKVLGSIFDVDGKKQSLTEFQMREKIRKASPFLLKGKTFTKLQRERMIKQWFPYQKVHGYITEQKTRDVLRKFRHIENWDKSYNARKQAKFSKKLLEAFTRVRKY